MATQPTTKKSTTGKNLTVWQMVAAKAAYYLGQDTNYAPNTKDVVPLEKGQSLTDFMSNQLLDLRHRMEKVPDAKNFKPQGLEHAASSLLRVDELSNFTLDNITTKVQTTKALMTGNFIIVQAKALIDSGLMDYGYADIMVTTLGNYQISLTDDLSDFKKKYKDQKTEGDFVAQVKVTCESAAKLLKYHIEIVKAFISLYKRIASTIRKANESRVGTKSKKGSFNPNLVLPTDKTEIISSIHKNYNEQVDIIVLLLTVDSVVNGVTGDTLATLDVNPCPIERDVIEKMAIEGGLFIGKGDWQRDYKPFKPETIKELFKGLVSTGIGVINCSTTGEILDGNLVTLVTDGQHRLTSLKRIVTNQIGIPIPCGIPDIDEACADLKCTELFFGNLPNSVQDLILGKKILFVIRNVSKLPLHILKPTELNVFNHLNNLGTAVPVTKKIANELGAQVYESLRRTVDEVSESVSLIGDDAKKISFIIQATLALNGTPSEQRSDLQNAAYRCFVGDGREYLSQEWLQGAEDAISSKEDLLQLVSSTLLFLAQNKIQGFFGDIGTNGKLVPSLNGLITLGMFLFGHPEVKFNENFATRLQLFNEYASDVSWKLAPEILKNYFQMALTDAMRDEDKKQTLESIAKAIFGMGADGAPLSSDHVDDMVTRLVKGASYILHKGHTNTKSYRQNRQFLFTLFIYGLLPTLPKVTTGA